jgi:heptosyltransferase-3
VQPAEADKRLILVPGAEAEAQVRTLLQSHALADASFVHVHPSSRWQFKCWPTERMAALIDALLGRGERVVMTSAPVEEERRMAAAILQRAGLGNRVVDLSGKLSLKGLAALTARARLFVGVDSAPMHIAAAMGTPVVALFGPSGDAEWGPWGVRHRVVSSMLHRCRPCGNDGCGGGKVSECLTTLPEAAVLAAVDDLLAEVLPIPPGA